MARTRRRVKEKVYSRANRRSFDKIRKTHVSRYMGYGQKYKYSEELRVTDKDVRKEAINLKVSTELNKLMRKKWVGECQNDKTFWKENHDIDRPYIKPATHEMSIKCSSFKTLFSILFPTKEIGKGAKYPPSC